MQHRRGREAAQRREVAGRMERALREERRAQWIPERTRMGKERDVPWDLVENGLCVVS